LCAQKTLGCIITKFFHGAEDFLKAASVNCQSTAQLSKLKLINTYQHTTTQHTLYRLTKLSNKYAITQNTDKEKLIEKLYH
jgi:predicted HAD superfamily phosphohydrolase